MNIKKDIKKQFNNAIELKNSKSYELALKIFFSLRKKIPNSAQLLVAIADTYWENNEIENAIKYFTQAIKLQPEWEIASLGLFHCLWIIDAKDRAFEEMKRFMAISDSLDYRAIVKEINSS